MDYWEECIREAFEDADIVATDQQIDIVINWVEGAHDNYSFAHGHHCIPNPLKEENEKLAKELEKEKRKIHCENCNGTGREITHGPYHSSYSECWKCKGEGRVSL